MSRARPINVSQGKAHDDMNIPFGAIITNDQGRWVFVGWSGGGIEHTLTALFVKEINPAMFNAHLRPETYSCYSTARLLTVFPEASMYLKPSAREEWDQL